MNRHIGFLLGLAFICVNSGCGEKQKKEKNRHEDKKEKDENIFTLPAELKEISGLSFLDDSTFIAIQDEEGVLYTYSLTQAKITAAKQFAGTGDFEDVALAGNDAFAIRSDGRIYHIKNFRESGTAIDIYSTPLNEKNNIEGLTYDKDKNRLLLASKDEGIDNDRDKEIFEFDLKTKKLNLHPILSIDISKIENYYKGDALEETSKKFLKALGNTNMNEVFRPSALTIHPTTKDIYVLSSINNVVAVFGDKGDLKKIFNLKGKEFIQPEGIAFTSSGSLYISNEGRSKKANVIKITY